MTIYNFSALFFFPGKNLHELIFVYFLFLFLFLSAASEMVDLILSSVPVEKPAENSPKLPIKVITKSFPEKTGGKKKGKRKKKKSSK